MRMNGYAEKHGGYEFEMVGDKLQITAEDKTSLELGTDALFGMLEYLVAVGAIAGLVQLVKKYPDGGLTYHVRLENEDEPEKSIMREVTVYLGEIEGFWPVEKWGEITKGLDEAAEDRKEAD